MARVTSMIPTSTSTLEDQFGCIARGRNCGGGSPMREFLQATSDGVSLAAIYSLAAASFVVVYRATNVFNFAQGAFMLLGGYLTFEIVDRFGVSTPVAVVVSLLLMGLIGAGCYQAVLRPMTGQPVFAMIIVTMGISIIVVGLVGVVWGYSPRTLPDVLGDGQIALVGGARISYLNAASVGVSLSAVVGLMAFFRFAPLGLRMRAAAESPVLASRRLINVERVNMLAWALGAVLACLAGALLAMRVGIAPSMQSVGLRAFPVALIGGFDSLRGALIGGLIVALLQTYAAILWGAQVQDLVVFGSMLVILLIRPYGIFGTREVLRV